jgi:hypothetical protein
MRASSILSKDLFYPRLPLDSEVLRTNIAFLFGSSCGSLDFLKIHIGLLIFSIVEELC